MRIFGCVHMSVTKSHRGVECTWCWINLTSLLKQYFLYSPTWIRRLDWPSGTVDIKKVLIIVKTRIRIFSLFVLEAKKNLHIMKSFMFSSISYAEVYILLHTFIADKVRNNTGTSFNPRPYRKDLLNTENLFFLERSQCEPSFHKRRCEPAL